MSLELRQFLRSRLYRLAQDQEPVPQVLAYHGTRQSALQSILDNGLLAHPFKRYHPSRFYKGERGDSVYVAEDAREAMDWALSAVESPDCAILLELCVPGDKLKPDEEREGAERFVGNIPTEWIKHVYPIRSNGDRGDPIPLGPGHDDGETRYVAIATKEGGPVKMPAQDRSWASPSFARDEPDAEDLLFDAGGWALDEFKEADVKRDEGGKFATQAGGGAPSHPDLVGRKVEHADPKAAVHFIGFREGDRYHNAEKVFGKPDFIHRDWDLRAQADIAPGDTVVFARAGDEGKAPTAYCYDDSNQPDDPAAAERREANTRKKPNLSIPDVVPRNAPELLEEASIRPPGMAKTIPAPKKTKKAYKLFRTLRGHPGKLYPLFINNAEGVEVGEDWYEAGNYPTKDFAKRPGWHAGALPAAPHLRTKGDTPRRAKDRVWVEVELPDDRNWQVEADKTIREIKHKGKPSTYMGGDLPDTVPVGGHYRWKPPGERLKMEDGSRAEWTISGAVRLVRELKNEEVRDILTEHGFPQSAEAESYQWPSLPKNKVARKAKPVADGWSSPSFARDEFREDQVKRDHGKFAKQAGAGAAQPEAKKTDQPESSSSKTNGKGTHPGHGYSAEARVVNGKIQTSNVNDAVRALWEGRKVSLDQPHQVSTLVAKLGGIAKRAEQLGGKAPNFDLCNVSVEGTNLFCAETKGIPRVQMPQLPDEKGPAFQKFLTDKGFEATEGEEKVSFLKATQSELVGAKVSGIMGFFRGRDPSQDPPLFISRDNYIVDGHHRWAARVGLDAEKNMLGNVKVKVVRVDLPIIELLEQAETFTEGKGHKAATAHDKRPRWTIPTFLAGDAAFKKKDLALDTALRSFLFDRLALALDKAEFKEANVKRDDDGKFAEQAGSGATEPTEAPEEEELPEEPKPAKGRARPIPAPAEGSQMESIATKLAKPKKPPKYKAPYGAETFMSPNVGNLTFEGAQSEVATKRHHAFADISDAIDIRLGIAPRAKEKHTEVIGAWTDGAENSLMVEYPRSDDPARSQLIRAAACIKGHLANQKQVLIFEPSEDGPHQMTSFEVKGSLDEIHTKLLSQGLENHTLEPTEGGARVHVFVEKKAIGELVEKAAKEAGSELTSDPGKGEFIGDHEYTGTDEEQRARAREEYENIIGAVEASSVGQKVRKVWDDAGNHWRSVVESTQKPLAGSAEGSHPATISSRRPSGTGSLESDEYRQINQKSMEEEPEKFKEITDLFKNPYAYINFRQGEFDGMEPHEVAEHVKKQFKDNLEFLYNHADDEVKKRGPQWYEGAHNMADDKATQYDKPVQSAAGVYAALSPQKDWDQNVYLADRLIEIHENHKDTEWDEAMTTRAFVKGEGKKKGLYYIKHPDKGPTDEEKKILAAAHGIVGKKYGDLTEPLEKAIWIRTYDEAHGDRHYNALNPDGSVIGPSLKKNGEPATAAWQSMPSIIKALAAWESNGDRNILSEAMGEKHKVRSFYNNILDPHSNNGDVTIDTHAVGAGLLMPLSGATQAVMHNLDTTPADEDIAPAKALGWKAAPKSKASGVTGTYGIWADAYRELAEKLNIPPRVLQSVTWESKRRLMPDTMTETTKRAISGAWSKYYLGDADLKTTQNEVFRVANEGKAATAKAWAEEAAKKETRAAQKVARAKAAEAKAAEKAAKAAARELKSGKSKERPAGPVHGEDGYPADAQRVDHARLGQRPAGAMDARARDGSAGRAAGHEPGRDRGQRRALMWSSPSYREMNADRHSSRPLWTVPSYRPPLLLAMDRSTFRRSEFSCTIAMDRTTARTLSEDGHLHVINNRISKATVNPYWGKEIPNFEQLGLDPEKKYMLLRHPKELERAATTFNNKPILAEHIPVSSAEHPHELVIGSTGTDARYEHPYLKSSLVFWPQAAIDAIQSEGQKELSCAYHYDPDMTPGVYEGQRFDGIMRNIRGNHVALVKDGRAGSDVVVQDAMPSGLRQWTSLPF